jgi:hypothetical protein
MKAVLSGVAALLVALLVAIGAPPPAAAQSTSLHHQAGSCGWDLTTDGVVSTNDLLFLLAVFGRDVAGDTQAALADGNGDGLVGTTDLLGLLAFFGRTCEAMSAPPPPPPVTPEAAAAEFEAALAAIAGDPEAALVSIASAITFEGDVSMVADGTARDEFEEGFRIGMAASLGDGARQCPHPPARVLDS